MMRDRETPSAMKDSTPRTDAKAVQYPGAGVNFDGMLNHARQLERELAEAKEAGSISYRRAELAEGKLRSAQSSARDSTCIRCGGSGDVKALVGGGPEAYEDDVTCPECGGTGACAARPTTAASDEEWRQFLKTVILGMTPEDYGRPQVALNRLAEEARRLLEIDRAERSTARDSDAADAARFRWMLPHLRVDWFGEYAEIGIVDGLPDIEIETEDVREAIDHARAASSATRGSGK